MYYKPDRTKNFFLEENKNETGEQYEKIKKDIDKAKIENVYYLRQCM